MRRPHDLSVPRVFAAGLVALDVLRVADAPGPLSVRAGGTAGNVAAILGALGWPVELAGPRDDSVAYTLLLEDLQRCGVHYHGVHRAAVPVIVEELAGCAEHRFLFDCPACGRALPRYRRVSNTLEAYWERSAHPVDVFFADRLSDDILAFAETAKKGGAFVVYEPSDPADERWADVMLDLADMVKYSADRAPALAWLAGGDHLEIRTLGSRGLQWRWPKERVPQWQSLVAVHTSRVVDTCGAGDWLTSGILIGLLEQLGPHRQWAHESPPMAALLENVLSQAQHLAAWSCGYAGARGALYESGPSAARSVMRPDRAWPTQSPVPEPSTVLNCVACPA